MVCVDDIVRVKVSRSVFSTPIDTSRLCRVVKSYTDGDVCVDYADGEKLRAVVSSSDIEPQSIREKIASRMNMITQLQREVADLQRQLDEDGDVS